MDRFSKMFGALDIYGHQIGVNYRSQGTYTTKLGALLSIATFVLSMMNLSTLLDAFINKTD